MTPRPSSAGLLLQPRRKVSSLGTDQFQSPRQIRHEHAVRVCLCADGAPFVQTRIHLRNVVCLGAGVLGEVEAAAGRENSLIEAVEEWPDTGLDGEVETEHEARVW